MPQFKCRTDVDLGIVISGMSLRRGETRTLEEISAFAGVSRQAVQHIERQALKKIRAKGFLMEELAEYFR